MSQLTSAHHSLLITLVVVVLVIGVVIWSQIGPEPEVEPTRPLFDVGVGTLPPLGSQNAPVKVIEFGDYACSFCGQYFKETLSKLRDEFVQTDQAQWYWRDFATLSSQSITMASTARCAAEQGKFWDYHDALVLDTNAQVDLDQKELESCLSSGRTDEAVTADHQEALRLGIQAAPTFFINGERIAGAQPYEALKAVILKYLPSRQNP